MKILMMNKYFHQKGGTEKYLFELSALLEKNGHQVIPFCMQHQQNRDTPYSRYFVPGVEYRSKQSPFAKIGAAIRTIHYPEAEKRADLLIRETQPDIIHIHNIYHQLTYAPLRAAKRHNLPVVMTAHDFKLVCPNYQMLCKGKICEKCSGGHYYNALRNRCGKGSFSESLILMLEMTYNRRIHDALQYIDLVIAPSRFMRDKLIEHGIPSEKVTHHFNSLDLSPYSPQFKGDGYGLYLGRLSAEKGINTLLEAMREVPEIPLKILGEGPEKDALTRLASELNLRNVEFLGYQSGEDLLETIRNASFVVVPSEWYENLPYSILEAFALGKPVIASRIGGIPELVQSGVNGYLFTPGNAEELAKRIRDLASDELMLREFGRNGRSLVQRECAPDKHYDIIMEHYERLIVKKKKQAESSSNSTT